MIRLLRQVLLVVAASAIATPALFAQNKTPHIGYVYPTGGQRGTYVEVTLGGQYIKEMSEVIVFGGGVEVEFVSYWRPLTQGEYVGLSQRIRFTKERLEEESGKKVTREEAIKEAGVTEEDLKQMEIYRQRDADRRRQPNSQIAEELTLKITIAEDAPLGKREVRLVTPAGMSNPIWFFVDQWEERRETEPNDVDPDPVVGDTLPVVVNGQIMPGDVDRFRFQGRKGTKLLINSACRELMPYLADAVPGWFQGVLVLYDDKGEQLVYSGAYHYRQDPLIYYEIPRDGDYIFEIRDSIFRGREDFVYRITLGELPFVSGIFPLGARANTDVTVELQGWNLAETQLDIRASLDRNRPVRWYTIPQNDKVDIRFPLRIDMITEILDQESNDTIETAQEVNMPCVVNGRIDKPDDRDVFKFSGFGTLEAEVFARRAGSPVDSGLLLTDAEGNEIGFNDDYRDQAYPLITHHADSRLNVGMRGKGPFYLHMTDSQRNGGHDFIYRLYIRRPLPDFDLRVVPSTIMAKPGANVPITVHALRRGEFDDFIQLQLVDAPEGFLITPDRVPAGEEKVQLTLTVPKEVPEEPVILEMDGHSLGSRRHRKFSRPAIPAESMMQAFLWLQIVPAEQWTIVVSGRPASKIPLEFPAEPIKFTLGESTSIDARITAKLPLPKEVQVELYEPPKGINVVKTTPKEGKEPGVTVEISADADLVRPGLTGNLVFEMFRQWTPAPTEKNPKPTERRTSYGYLKAMPFEVENSRKKS